MLMLAQPFCALVFKNFLWTCHKSFTQTAIKGPFKKYVTRKMVFLNPALPMSQIAIFLLNPRPLCLVYENVANYSKKQSNSFFYIMAAETYQHYNKGGRKGHKLQF